MKLSSFLQQSQPLYTKDPNLFFEILQELTTFVKKARVGSSAVETYVEISVKSMSSSDVDENNLKAWTMSVISPVVDAILLRINSDNFGADKMYTLNDLLEVLALTIPFSTLLPHLLCTSEYFCSRVNYVKSIQNNQNKMVYTKGFCSFLVRNVISVSCDGKVAVDTLSTADSVVRSAMQLLVVLGCGGKLFARRTVIDAIAYCLQHRLLKSSVDDIEEQTRLVALSRLACLCKLIVRSPQNIESGRSVRANQQLCLEGVCYLFSKDIPNLLTIALSTVSLNHKLVNRVVDVFAETLEILIRPKLLCQIEKVNDKMKSVLSTNSASAVVHVDLDTNAVTDEDEVFDNEVVSSVQENVIVDMFSASQIGTSRRVLETDNEVDEQSESDHDEEDDEVDFNEMVI